jgi:hypothetical protein
MKVSVLIPSRSELFMPQTVADVFSKAKGEIEVIVVLDGYWPDPPLPAYPNLHLIHHGEPKGMRTCINEAAELAKGEFLCKADAHCLFGEGFDIILAEDCDKDWLVIPRRVSLDAENWCIEHTGKSPVDYEYLSHPSVDKDRAGIHGRVWNERARDRKDILVDENMSFQGSCWFIHRDYFWKQGPLQNAGYGDFIQEPQELGLRTWLSGGKQMTNKKTFYAHLHKGTRYHRGYFLNKKDLHAGTQFSTDFWMNNRPFPGRVHDMEWLVDRFWPVPTWPENWKELPDPAGVA